MAHSHWIASGGGIGHVPVAPGTAASLVAVLIGALAMWLDHRLLAVARHRRLRHRPLGCPRRPKEPGDPGWIVIDEFAGQWIAMLGLGHVSLYGSDRRVRPVPLLRHHQTRSGRMGRPEAWRDRRHGGRRRGGPDRGGDSVRRRQSCSRPETVTIGCLNSCGHPRKLQSNAAAADRDRPSHVRPKIGRRPAARCARTCRAARTRRGPNRPIVPIR